MDIFLMIDFSVFVLFTINEMDTFLIIDLELVSYLQ